MANGPLRLVTAFDCRQALTEYIDISVIIAGQISAAETLVCFKVIAFQAPHTASVLGVTVQVTTDADRNGTRAAKFEEQAKERERMVVERIQQVIGGDGARYYRGTS